MADARLGDDEFADLYRGYRRRVHRLAVRLVGPADATDVVQEVMLRAWRCPPVISDQRQVWPWLRTVTRNVCVDVLRSRREEPTPEIMIEALLPLVPDEPSTAGVRADDRRLLRLALDRLSTREADLLLSHEVDGIPASKIARAEGSTPNAMRQHLFRTRRKLARHYRNVKGGLLVLVVASNLMASYSQPECRLSTPTVSYRVPDRVWVPGPPERGPGPRPWDDTALAYDEARRQYLLVSSSPVGAQTWAWSASGWVELRPAHPLPALRELNAVYDSTRRHVVVLGFSDDAFETWIWNGDWTLRGRRSLREFPSRTGYSAAYDASNDVVAVFGGRSAPTGAGGGVLSAVHSRVLGELHLWTPGSSTWRRVTPLWSPPARYEAAMAYDASRAEIVLFGGMVTGARLGDTWIWDGTGWTQKLGIHVGPLARAGAAMAGTRTGLLLFGGTDGLTTFTDTWRWDGSSWVNLTQAGPQRGDGRLRMDYDPARDALMLVGDLRTDVLARSVFFFEAPTHPSAPGLNVQVPEVTASVQPSAVEPVEVRPRPARTEDPRAPGLPVVPGGYVDCT